MEPKKSLAKTHPKIAREAHGWNPSDVLPGSGKKYEWICPKKHVWVESCNSRTNPNRSENAGCPYCKGVKVLKGYNDLQTKNPMLAKEADGWDPSEFLAGSHKKVKWMCRKGHKWEAELRTRSVNGYGCPFCSGLRPIVGETDLASTHPEVAKEADGWDPTTVKKASNKKLKWKCKLGHNWTASPGERISGTRSGKPNGCPFCSGQRLLKGFNDLKTINPAVAKEAYKWDPSTLTSGASIKKKWKCKEGHIWDALVYSRKTTGCPFCSGRKAIKGANDLKTINPKLARELLSADATKLKASSHVKVEWKCNKGHIWKALVSDRTRGDGCPTCSGKRLLVGFNDLATTHPDIAAQAFGWDPQKIGKGSIKSLKWVCSDGHYWQSSPNSRISGTKSGKPNSCPICSGHKLQEGFNDLATTHPDIAAQAFGWDPATVQAGSHGTYLWKCGKGHVFNGQIYNRVIRSSGPNCPVCSNRQVESGFNDIATTHPELAAEANGWDTSKITAGTNVRLEWKCRLNHIWKATGNNRIQGNGCPVCANKVILVGFNDLATTNPDLASQMLTGDPTRVTAGSGKNFKWKCEKGHTWNADVANRTTGTGCPSCAVGGFDPNIEAWLYFLIHEEWDMHQIGITNYPDDRLASHRRLGWKLLELRGPMQGDVTYAWEQSILKALKENGADIGNTSIAGKFDGFSEAWVRNSYPVKKLKDLMDLVRASED